MSADTRGEGNAAGQAAERAAKIGAKSAAKSASSGVEMRRRRVLWIARWVLFTLLLAVGTVLMLGQMSHKSSSGKDPSAASDTRHWA